MIKEVRKFLRSCVLCGILTCTGCSSDSVRQVTIDLECGDTESNTIEVINPAPETKLIIGESTFSLRENGLVSNIPGLPQDVIFSNRYSGEITDQVSFRVGRSSGNNDNLLLETECHKPNPYSVAVEQLYICEDQKHPIGQLAITGLTENQMIAPFGSSGIRYSPEQQGFVVENNGVTSLLQRVEMPDTTQLRKHGENEMLLEDDEPIAEAYYESAEVRHTFSTTDGSTIIYTAECLTETTEDPRPTSLPTAEPTASACVRQYSDDHPTEAPCINTPSN